MTFAPKKHLPKILALALMTGAGVAILGPHPPQEADVKSLLGAY